MMQSSPARLADASTTRRRRLWLNLHLTVALTLGAVIALMGLSGAALALKGPLIRHDFGAATFDPPASRQAEWASVDGWVAQARQRYPQMRRLVSVTAPGASPLPTRAALLTITLADGGFGFVTVDPRSAQPLGLFRYGDGWLFKILDLHRHLLLPGALEDAGDRIVTWSGLLLLLSAGTGLYLWWPCADTWRRALRIQGGAQLWRSLHKTLGICVLVPSALAAASGVLIAQPDWSAWLDDPGKPGPAAPLVSGSGCHPVAGYAAAARQAMQAIQADELISISATPDAQAFLVRVHGGGQRRGSETTLRVDAGCGTVTAQPAGKSGLVRQAQLLHAELMLGWPGRIIVMLTGLALPVLYASGLWMWWRKRTINKNRRKASHA